MKNASLNLVKETLSSVIKTALAENNLHRKGTLSAEIITIALPVSVGKINNPDFTEVDSGIFWSDAVNSNKILALHNAWSIELSGNDRFSKVGIAFKNFINSWKITNPSNLDCKPQLFFQYAFDAEDPMLHEWQAIPNMLLTLPLLQLIEYKNSQYLLLSHKTNCSSKELYLNWEHALHRLDLILTNNSDSTNAITNINPKKLNSELIKQVIEELKSPSTEKNNKLKKVVVGERQKITYTKQITPTTLLKHHKKNSLFYYYSNNRHQFLSLPPELLLKKQEKNIFSDALAGTLPNDSLQNTSNKNLLTDNKLRDEQDVVIKFIQQQLNKYCSSTSSSTKPKIHKLEKVQHLLSAIRGKLDTKFSNRREVIFQIAGSLQQSPAVCGMPKESSLEWLRSHNNSNRGLYCGGAGWIDYEGNGEIHVLLRCALLKGKQASIYAGAGILSQSTYEEELSEIELKLKSICNYD